MAGRSAVGPACHSPSDLLAAAARRGSGYSNSEGGACLDVADNHPSLVPVRDSKDPARGALVLDAKAWSRFVAAVQRV